MKLFDDDVLDADDVSKIEINPEFAKRYEHNKKREDLHKYEEMKKKGLIESGSESVSESDSEGADDIVDSKFIDRLLKIRKKDPNLLQKEAKLFDSSDDDDDKEKKEEAAKKAKKAKPKYLKDLNAENLIENGAEFDDDDDEDEEKERKKVKSFVEEQEDLRKSVLAAMAEEEEERLIGDDDDDDGLLTVKERDVVEEDEVDGEMNEKLDEFFGEDEKLDENDKFLKDFFRNKMWIDKDKGGNDNVGEIELSDDEEAVLRQEEYERDFNFRFEESKSDRVLGHSRVVVDSVRNDKNTRKLQRERKKDKERLAKIEMDEEVKRLKNLKRAEIRDRLRKIREIAGVVDQDQDQGGIPLDEDYLEKDFDPKEFDETMKVAFGDDYYQADDDHFKPVFGSDDDDLEKPDFGKEDELLGLPKDWDVIKSKDGFLAKRGNKDNKEIIVDDDDDDEEEEEHEEKVEEGKRKRKRKSKIGEALKKELEEELYKYDYEDAIGDLKTRFKYRKVKPNKYKLSAAEVLWYDEQELNQYVSLKKLAPYREQEWEVRGDRKNMLNVGILSGKNMNEKKGKMDGEGSSKTIDEEQSNKDETKQSRGAKRRENMKKKQLSVSRLVAYGKKPSSSSKKKLN